MEKSHPYKPDWEILELCYDPKQGYGYHLIVHCLDNNKIYYWAVHDLNWRYTFDKCKVHTNEIFNRNFFRKERE